MDLLDCYIINKIGSYNDVIHEIVSPDIHVDIIPIPPMKGKEYYTLVTMGMGAYRMKVPPHYAKSKFNRAELAIRLPKDWDIYSDKEEWYWPIRLLKELARMPLTEKSWLGYGHSIDYGTPITDNTELCAVVLDFLFDGDEEPLRLSNGDGVLMYNVIPIYREEMEFKKANSADVLFDRLGKDEITSPFNIQRANCCL
jgi:hypothetical protein